MCQCVLYSSLSIDANGQARAWRYYMVYPLPKITPMFLDPAWLVDEPSFDGL